MKRKLWLVLCALAMPALAAAAVPQPVRDSAYDWRCLNPDGTATNHQRQDTAIYACQTRAEQSPGETFYIEGGRYRVLVEAPDPVPDPQGTVTLRWTPPTKNTDGSPLTDLAAYRVHWGPGRRDYTSSTLISDPGATTAEVSGLVVGQSYYFAVTAINSAGNESAYSSELSRAAQ